VTLEADSVATTVARQHLGATHSVAFDAYHAYSAQYPMEHSAFQRACERAGSQPSIDRSGDIPPPGRSLR